MLSFTNKVRFFPFVLSLAGALTLSFDSYLHLQGKSLCKTTACEIVGITIRFGEPFLIAGGAAFFWIFFLAYFFSRRYPKFFKNIPSILLLTALAFDGALIGFQHFSIQQRCLLCFSVAALLMTLALSLTAFQKSYLFFFSALCIWIGSFMALGILKMPLPSSAYANMAFYEYKVQSTKAMQFVIKDAPVFTLIMSVNCPHCSDVISYLSDNPHVANNFKFVTIDQDTDSLKKISRFKNEVTGNNNPFELFKSIKAKSEPSSQDIAQGLTQQAAYGLQFLNNLGIATIPILVVESTSNMQILRGSETIIRFLQNTEN